MASVQTAYPLFGSLLLTPEVGKSNYRDMKYESISSFKSSVLIDTKISVNEGSRIARCIGNNFIIACLRHFARKNSGGRYPVLTVVRRDYGLQTVN